MNALQRLFKEVLGEERRYRITIAAVQHFDQKTLAEFGSAILYLFQFAREIQIEVADYEGVVLLAKAYEKQIQLWASEESRIHHRIEVSIEEVEG